MEKFVIIDNGHGAETRGKCSPDGCLQEWKWTRRVARELSQALSEIGIGNALLVPGDADVALGQRCRLANMLAREHPGAILVSVHSNASGDGREWGKASGWSAFVAPNASDDSRALARELFAAAKERDILGNRLTPPCGYNVASLAMCRDTRCPAVLTENMFHDNRADVDFMLSADGIGCIVAVHLTGIINYYKGRA